MIPGITAVAFDLDGTLYPNHGLYFRLLPFFFRHGRLLAAFGRARDIIRREQKRDPAALLPDFYGYQAQLTAQLLKIRDKDAAEKLRQRIDTLIYRGWEPYFTTIKLFPHVKEVLGELRGAGLKMGMLSDFPPQKKLENLGLGGLWDVILSSEAAGALKPALKPFAELAAALGCPPEQILYVGNSHPYDVIGAARLGMKTAHITLLGGTSKANFVFHDYRQLRNFVLK